MVSAQVSWHAPAKTSCNAWKTSTAAPSKAAGSIRLRASDDGGTRSVNTSRPLGRSNAGDSIVDFGFAKTAEATFAQWNRQRVLERLVAVIRAEKPDIVWPTFLDVPGQHGSGFDAAGFGLVLGARWNF